MYTRDQAIALLTVLDIGLMLGLLYISGEMEGQTKVVAGVLLVGAGVVVGYRTLVR